MKVAPAACDDRHRQRPQAGLDSAASRQFHKHNPQALEPLVGREAPCFVTRVAASTSEPRYGVTAESLVRLRAGSGGHPISRAGLSDAICICRCAPQTFLHHGLETQKWPAASATLGGQSYAEAIKVISISTVSRNAATSELYTPFPPGITICPRLSRITTAAFPTRLCNLLANMQCREQS